MSKTAEKNSSVEDLKSGFENFFNKSIFNIEGLRFRSNNFEKKTTNFHEEIENAVKASISNTVNSNNISSIKNLNKQDPKNFSQLEFATSYRSAIHAFLGLTDLNPEQLNELYLLSGDLPGSKDINSPYLKIVTQNFFGINPKRFEKKPLLNALSHIISIPLSFTFNTLGLFGSLLTNTLKIFTEMLPLFLKNASFVCMAFCHSVITNPNIKNPGLKALAVMGFVVAATVYAIAKIIHVVDRIITSPKNSARAAYQIGEQLLGPDSKSGKILGGVLATMSLVFSIISLAALAKIAIIKLAAVAPKIVTHAPDFIVKSYQFLNTNPTFLKVFSRVGDKVKIPLAWLGKTIGSHLGLTTLDSVQTGQAVTAGVTAVALDCATTKDLAFKCAKTTASAFSHLVDQAGKTIDTFRNHSSNSIREAPVPRQS
jgi:hypothetical protein